MKTNKFSDFMGRFEKEVILKSFRNNGGKIKVVDAIVPLNYGKKWVKEDFADFIGKTFEAEEPLSINYYGYFKLSTGLVQKVEKAKEIFPVVKSVKAPIIHFNSIRIEHIKKYSPSLMNNYTEFKKYLVELRWSK